MVSRSDLAVVTAAALCGAIWIESGHRISIDAPVPSEAAVREPASVCPDNDNVPYTAGCLAFMERDSAEKRWPARVTTSAPRASPHAQKHTELGPGDSAGNVCPDNDNQPYTPTCVAFLTGWFWRPVQ